MSFANANTIVPGFMEGVPKFSLVGGPSLLVMLMLVLPAYWAVVAHLVIIHFMAVLGMYMLCKKYIAKENEIISVSVALGFGLQYFLQAFSLGIAAIPFLIFVFLDLYHKQANWKHWLVLLLYTYATNLQSVGIYVFGLWFLGWLILAIRQKVWYVKLLLANVFMLVVSVAMRIGLLKNLLAGKSFVSHRTEFHHYGSNKTLRLFLSSVKEKFLSDGTLWLVITCCLLAIIIGLYKKNRLSKYPLFLTSAVVLVWFFITALRIPAVNSFRNAHYLLRIYSLDRFSVFVPLFWYVAWAFALGILFGSRFKKVIMLLGIIQVVLLFRSNASWQNIFGQNFNNQSRAFAGYYAPDLFDSVKAAISLPLGSYKIGSLGIAPAAAQYNGLFTIDGECTNYPLAYKHLFGKIIEPELLRIDHQIPIVENDFRNWGHKCYLLTKELDGVIKLQPVDKINPSKVDSPHWNMEAFKALGGSYLISSVPIKYPAYTGLNFVKSFENNSYHLDLYKVN